jgi:thiamine biosynthesis lipoprotein
MAVEARFHAMGTSVHLFVVEGDGELLGSARRRLEDLEARWSRFLPTSEISRLNAEAGRSVPVSRETFDVIERAVHAWELTGGRFDPTVLHALVQVGYDRSFDSLDPAGPARCSGAAPGCGGIKLASGACAVTLPVGVGLDLGGIAKGLAADWLAQELVASGAAGACVNIGGDVRLLGEAPAAEGWIVGVQDPFCPEDELMRFALAEGAVVTTTRLKRAWKQGGLDRHHVIDPASGNPGWTGVAAVSVIANEAYWAEVMAKAAFLAGVEEGNEVLTAAGLTGVIVDDTGCLCPVSGLEAFTI